LRQAADSGSCLSEGQEVIEGVRMKDSLYEVIKIDEGTWRIEEGKVRAFLFVGAEKALLVDSGFGTGNIKDVVGVLTQLPIMLVNTHADPDHIGCNALFEKAYMHPAEFAYYETASTGAMAPLWEGDVIDIGKRRFEVLLIPGHTPGSIALLDRGNRVLVAGDSVSASPIFMFSKHRSLRALVDSMERLSIFRESFDWVYPSHGPFPVGPDLIEKIKRGARRVLNREIPAEEPPIDIPAKLYDVDGVKFYYAAD
jgi:glyoxylase-like metal-dependent hydrolase (beta-lactamase superfamily II)